VTSQRIHVPKDFEDLTVQINRAFENLHSATTAKPNAAAVPTVQTPAVAAPIPTGVVGPSSGTQSGLITVATDGTLTGDGTTGAPLSVVGTKGSGAYVYNNSTQNIANGFAAVPLQFPTMQYDDSGYWNPAANTQLVAPIAGLYAFGAFVHWTGLTAGQRQLGVLINGVAPPGQDHINASAPADPNDPAMSHNVQYRLAAGDIVTWFVAQDTTTNPLTTIKAAAWIALLGI
jgi:hypothetical protein